MKIENVRLNESILNFNESVKKRNEVAEYYFEHGIQETMDHFKLTKQGVYSDVRAYKKFIGAYNLLSNTKTSKDFLNLNSKDLVPLFNNPKVGKFFDKDCKVKDLDFSNKNEIRHFIGGLKSYNQLKEFIIAHADLLRGEVE